MCVKAIKVARWLVENPDNRLTESVLKTILNVNSLIGVDLSEVDLSEADLSGANLSGADLSGADLSDTALFNADLSEADLSGANLTGSLITETKLSFANLRMANLAAARLCDVNLYGADLSDVHFTDTHLLGTNMANAKTHVAQVTGVYPLQVILQPTPADWYARVGGFYDTLSELTCVAYSDNDNDGAQELSHINANYRPQLQAVCDLFHAHVNHPEHADVIDKLAKKWGAK